MKLIAALATDDGKKFVNRHFGDAKKYYIYEITNESYMFIKSINNTSVEEKQHADPKKARSIINILKSEGVQVVDNLAFGANINRVKKKLVPVITAKTTLKEGLKELIANHENLIKLWEQGEKRDYLNLK
ncbi:MAG: NifB/NifX family molybdenum-iron cluster-binding protein [Bacillota bacterium]